MQFIRNSNIMEDACRQFVQSHPCHYSFHAEMGK
jgi:hypothetical protein